MMVDFGEYSNEMFVVPCQPSMDYDHLDKGYIFSIEMSLFNLIFQIGFKSKTFLIAWLDFYMLLN